MRASNTEYMLLAHILLGSGLANKLLHFTLCCAPSYLRRHFFKYAFISSSRLNFEWSRIFFIWYVVEDVKRRIYTIGFEWFLKHDWCFIFFVKKGSRCNEHILSGFVAATVINPVWLVKTRLQLHKGHLSITDCIKRVWAKDGIKGFYRVSIMLISFCNVLKLKKNRESGSDSDCFLYRSAF